MKKFLIVMIVLLIFLAIGQVIYYKTRSNNISSNGLENFYLEDSAQEEKLLEIKGLDSIYNEYSPKISMEKLQKNMYKFIESISSLKNEIHNLNTEQLKSYFQENNTFIMQNYYINSEEEFIMIGKQLQNIFNANDVVLYEYGMELASISQLQNGIICFNMIFTFDNDIALKVKVNLSQTSDNMLITSASDLDKIYDTYTGNIKKIEVLDKISTFVKNISNLKTATSLKSENEKREYFTINNELMQELGITTQDDFISVAYQINNMKWTYGNTAFKNYSINYESLRNEEDYTSFEVKLYFSDENEMHLIISISNDENVEKPIKIKGNNQDILDKIHELDPNINLNEIDINNLNQ